MVDDDGQSLRCTCADAIGLSIRCQRLKIFNDVTKQSGVIPLHEQINFCKNMQITAKQHKKTHNNTHSKFLGSKHANVEKREKEELKINDQSGKKIEAKCSGSDESSNNQGSKEVGSGLTVNELGHMSS